jgi:hypothetical protein
MTEKEMKIAGMKFTFENILEIMDNTGNYMAMINSSNITEEEIKDVEESLGVIESLSLAVCSEVLTIFGD